MISSTTRSRLRARVRPEERANPPRDARAKRPDENTVFARRRPAASRRLQACISARGNGRHRRGVSREIGGKCVARATRRRGGTITRGRRRIAEVHVSPDVKTRRRNRVHARYTLDFFNKSEIRAALRGLVFYAGTRRFAVRSTTPHFSLVTHTHTHTHTHTVRARDHVRSTRRSVALRILGFPVKGPDGSR